MRGLRFVVLLASLVMLGGCASTSTTGVCARASDRDLSSELGWPSFRDESFRPKNPKVAPHRPLHGVADRLAPQDDTPEPRFTSVEWWQRENTRLGKAVLICRGCLPTVVATVAPPKAVSLE